MADGDANKWDFDEKREMKTNRLIEWGVTTLLEQVVLRVGYVRSARELEIYGTTDHVPHQVQVSISASAARELSIQLSRYADLSDRKLLTGITAKPI